MLVLRYNRKYILKVYIFKIYIEHSCNIFNVTHALDCHQIGRSPLYPPVTCRLPPSFLLYPNDATLTGPQKADGHKIVKKYELL